MTELNAERLSDSEAKITREEMVELFGEAMPVEAVNLLWDSDGSKTIGQVRAELRHMATLAREALAARQARRSTDTALPVSEEAVEAEARRLCRLAGLDPDGCGIPAGAADDLRWRYFERKAREGLVSVDALRERLDETMGALDATREQVVSYEQIIATVNDCVDRMQKAGESHAMLAKWISEGINATRSPTGGRDAAEPVAWPLWGVSAGMIEAAFVEGYETGIGNDRNLIEECWPHSQAKADHDAMRLRAAPPAPQLPTLTAEMARKIREAIEDYPYGSEVVDCRAEWIWRALGGAPWDEPVAAAVAAPQLAVTVRPLEWGKTSYGTPEARSVVGIYRINDAANGGWTVSIRQEVLRDGERVNFATIDRAKAAAQADYETRIRSALIATPQPAVTVTEEMVEAVGEAIYGRHERGWVMWPLMDGERQREAIGAALAPIPQGEGREAALEEAAKTVELLEHSYAKKDHGYEHKVGYHDALRDAAQELRSRALSKQPGRK